MRIEMEISRILSNIIQGDILQRTIGGSKLTNIVEKVLQDQETIKVEDDLKGSSISDVIESKIEFDKDWAKLS